MKIGPPGKRHRCPACSTPFVIGERIASPAAGEAEFLTFEVADEAAAKASLDAVGPIPKRAPKPPPPRSKGSVKTPHSNPLPRKGPGPPAEDKLDVDFELSLDEEASRYEPLLHAE